MPHGRVLDTPISTTRRLFWGANDIDKEVKSNTPSAIIGSESSAMMQGCLTGELVNTKKERENESK